MSEAAEKAARTKYKKDLLVVGMKCREIFVLMEFDWLRTYEMRSWKHEETSSIARFHPSQTNTWH